MTLSNDSEENLQPQKKRMSNRCGKMLTTGDSERRENESSL